MKGVKLGVEQVTERQLDIIPIQGLRQVDVLTCLDARIRQVSQSHHVSSHAIAAQLL
ncbi:hypothetical protein D3C78_1868940 [compost metagenome]